VLCADGVGARASRANGGLCLDSWHFFRGGADLAQIAALRRVVEGAQR
jgi:hypothetical protein